MRENIIEQLRFCASRFSCEGCIGECKTSSNEPRAKDVLNDAADAIEELLDELTTIRKQLPHWISVEERLPEKHKVVLFNIPWNKTNMIGWIDEGGGINLEGYGKCYDFSLIKPSHWMTLPEAPKEE